MGQRGRNVAKKVVEGKPPARVRKITEQEVEDFLRQNPNFLRENPHIILDHALPNRNLGENVVDLQEAMIRYLRHEIGHIEELQETLIETTRQNMFNQQKIYNCVNSLLQARSLENVVDIISTDFAEYLRLISVRLCMEPDGSNLHMLRHVAILAPGTVDLFLGSRKVLLRKDIFGEIEVFGRVAALIRSDAMVRLSVGGSVGGVMLAFGSDEEDCFSDDQDPVLINFLARCVEQLLLIWMDK